MKHRNHLIPCVIIAVVAVMLFAASGSASIGAGVGLALLLCPLVMGTVMWLLMRQNTGSSGSEGHAPADPLEHRQAYSGARKR